MVCLQMAACFQFVIEGVSNHILHILQLTLELLQFLLNRCLYVKKILLGLLPFAMAPVALIELA